MSNVTTNFDILDRAEKLELLASEIYAAFAIRFGDDPAALKLFNLLRDEEQQHAARIRMVSAQARRDSRLLGKISVDVKAMDEVAQELVTILANLRAGRWEGNLVQTKRLMLDLEERCSRAHAQGLLGLNDSLKKFFEALALQDKAHAELLKG